MRNFIFISPNFPDIYWKFCKELKNNGFNVLGIGDCPYNQLSEEVKSSLEEYYWVTNLQNYDEVYRAVAFFTFRYGKIEFIESNNEFWLERDAMLRTEFNVKTGFLQKDIKKIKFKSQMKRYYQKAEVPVAQYHLVKGLKGCLNFIEKVGYPVIVKPDNGVGANDTHRINNETALKDFLQHKLPVQYIMEEYIEGEVNTYDAIVDGDGNPVFETGNVTLNDLMGVVNNNDNSVFYIVNEPFEDVRDAGRRTLKAFKVKNRFVHFEFFRLTKDQRLGKKGDIVALEVNMRPSGGISPDMMNYANSTDVFKIWADVMAYGTSEKGCGEKFYCAFAGRRDGKNFVYSEQEINEKYAENMKNVARVPDVLSGAMGNTMYIANFKTKKEMEQFYRDVLKVN